MRLGFRESEAMAENFLFAAGGNIYQQKEKLRITEAAKDYLLAELAKRGCK